MPFVLADKYSSGPYEGRPQYFHSWTNIGPSATPKIEEAERFDTAQAAMRSPAFSHWSSFYEPLEITNAGADETDCCLACLVPFKVGDEWLPDASGGALHYACCGPERESYTNKDGDPLGPDDPIPAALIWTAFPADHYAAVLGEGVTRRSAPDEPLIQPPSDTPSPAGKGEL